DRLKLKWTSPIYGFFTSTPTLEFFSVRECHVFTCANPRCIGRVASHPGTVRRYQDTADANSTGNLRTHVKKCWGDVALEHSKAAADAAAIRTLATSKGGVITEESIVMAFGRKGKGAVTYSTKPHTRDETRVEVVRWVAESMRPFEIVKDRGFNSLMKTGRPHYWIPSPSTVIRDSKLVFMRVRNRIAKLLQDHPGSLHFATDSWSSPNHKSYVAFTVHFEQDGVPISLLLDFVELPK
ncbi:hypothetical protein BKA70DRAFT_1056220, partial [Coprinopsis sp. MPI-PUGE-AT-0042]